MDGLPKKAVFVGMIVTVAASIGSMMYVQSNLDSIQAGEIREFALNESDFSDIFWRICSVLGDDITFVALIPVLIYGYDFNVACHFTSNIMVALYYNNWLKALLHDARPYWTSPTIEGKVCEEEYGNPSGHAMMAASGWPLLAILISFERSLPKWKAFALVSTSAVVAFLVGYSRIYNGAHFQYQVFLGWAFGISTLFAHLSLAPIVVSFETRILRLYAIPLCAILLATLLLLAQIPEIIDPFELPSLWIEQNERDCPDDRISAYGSKRSMYLAAGILATTPFGIYFRNKHAQMWDGNWAEPGKGGATKKAMRSLIALVVAVSVYFGLGFIPKDINETALLITRYLLRSVVLILVEFVPLPLLFIKYRLLVPPGEQVQSKV